MTADPYAPARRATNGGHGCAIPEHQQPRRVFVTADFAGFNEGTRRARVENRRRRDEQDRYERTKGETA